MNNFIVLVLCLSAAAAYEVVQFEDGQESRQEFYLVPVQSVHDRERRQTSGQPSGSSATVHAQHSPKYGTDIGVNANANLWRNGNNRLDAVGNYNRHFGGIGGTGRPNYYGGLNFQHRF